MSRQLYDNDLFLSSTTMTSIHDFLSSTYQQVNPQNETTVFIRTFIFIAIAMILFFVLIVLIIIIFIRTHRFHVSSTTCEDKVSSSSFAQSTSTALSTDSTNINYHRQLNQQPVSTITSVSYENILTKSTFVHGLVPQTNLSPRFHRQQQLVEEKRRIPLQIRSPSLTRINPFIDHGALTTTNEDLAKKRSPLPKVTRLQNGDVIISA